MINVDIECGGFSPPLSKLNKTHSIQSSRLKLIRALLSISLQSVIKSSPPKSILTFPIYSAAFLGLFHASLKVDMSPRMDSFIFKGLGTALREYIGWAHTLVQVISLWRDGIKLKS